MGFLAEMIFSMSVLDGNQFIFGLALIRWTFIFLLRIDHKQLKMPESKALRKKETCPMPCLNYWEEVKSWDDGWNDT